MKKESSNELAITGVEFICIGFIVFLFYKMIDIVNQPILFRFLLLFIFAAAVYIAFEMFFYSLIKESQYFAAIVVFTLGYIAFFIGVLLVNALANNDALIGTIVLGIIALTAFFSSVAVYIKKHGKEKFRLWLVILLAAVIIGVVGVAIYQEYDLTTLHTFKDKHSSYDITHDEDTIVYWVAGGAVYHLYGNCPHLSDSANVRKGCLSDCPSGRRCCITCSEK